MTAEPKLPPFPDVPSRFSEMDAVEVHAYGLRCFEAGRQQAQMAAPSGWILVPEKPTDRMIALANDRHDFWFAEYVYETMLSAAPSPPKA